MTDNKQPTSSSLWADDDCQRPSKRLRPHDANDLSEAEDKDLSSSKKNKIKRENDIGDDDHVGNGADDIDGDHDEDDDDDDDDVEVDVIEINSEEINDDDNDDFDDEDEDDVYVSHNMMENEDYYDELDKKEASESSHSKAWWSYTGRCISDELHTIMKDPFIDYGGCNRSDDDDNRTEDVSNVAAKLVRVRQILQEQPLAAHLIDKYDRLPLDYFASWYCECDNNTASVLEESLVEDGTFGDYSLAEKVIQANPGAIFSSGLVGLIRQGVAMERLLDIAFPDGPLQKLQVPRSCGTCLPVHVAASFAWMSCVSNVLVLMLLCSEPVRTPTIPGGQLPLHLALSCSGMVNKSLILTKLEHLQSVIPVWSEDNRYLKERVTASLQTVVHLVVAYPEAVAIPDADGLLPFHTACKNNCRMDVLRYLLEKKPDSVDIPDAKGRLPFQLACLNNCNLNVLRLLLETKPSSLVKRDSDGILPFYAACFHGCTLDVLYFLLRQNPQVLSDASA